MPKIFLQFLLAPIEHMLGMSTEEEFLYCKNQLVSDYGITCSSDCSCFDPAIPGLIKEGRRLFGTVIVLARQQRIEEPLAIGDKLLDSYRRLNVSWMYRGVLEYNLFLLAIAKSDFLPKAVHSFGS